MRLVDLTAGWMEDFTNWFRDQLLALWEAFVQFIRDAVVYLIEALLDLFATALEALPVPEFVTNYSLDNLLGQAGPVIGWVATTFRLGEGLGIIAAGYAFRLLRKLFTLGQW